MNAAVHRLEEDKTARRRALEPVSFIVEAPAGAGKTELLTQRYLCLLARVQHPEEVLALTFTNKAATEMRDRILGSLEVAASGFVPEAEHKRVTYHLACAVLAQDAAQGWGLLAHPGRLRITTLDALCANLARQMPYLSRFGGQPRVADDAVAHYATAARRTLEMLESAADGSAADADVVAAALAFMANDAGRLERLLVSMLGRRDQWLQHAVRIESGAMKPEVEAGFAALIERDLRAVAVQLDSRLQSLLLPLARFAGANAPAMLGCLAHWHETLCGELEELPLWRALAALLLTGTGSLRKSLTKNNGFPAGLPFAEQKAAMLAVLEEMRGIAGLEGALGGLAHLPQPELSDTEWATVENFSRLLRLAAGQLWLVFQEAGEVDFVEIATRAGQALGDDEAPTDLALALDYRIQHLLVDEFQDTSPSQVALLAKLMRGWQADDGRTLFVVGDPMQSIYRFRKADVGLFLRVRERGLGGVRLEHLRLYRNNRSFPGIVDWVNAAFPGIFPAEDSPEAGAVRYAESAATREARSDAGVSVHPVILAAGEEGGEREAGLVLNLILAARRDFPLERIAVLVRARSHLDALVAEIRRSAPDLRFQAVDIEGLAERQHIQDLLTLYRALCHRADRVHWLALLRAPWCGLTLADLHALVGGDRQRTVWQLMHDESRLAAMSDAGRQRLLAVRAVLVLAFDERGRQAPRRWLEGVWLMLGGPRCLESREALPDVEAFWFLVDRLAAGGNLTPETLAEQAAELYAPPDPLAGEAVQMMTIHKSKGLEFETVILPGLERTTGANDSTLLLWDETAGGDGREHLLVAPMKAKGADSELATAYDFLRKLEAERSAHETERLLYVAATRAIRKLHLVACATADEKPEGRVVKMPPAGSLLSLLWPCGSEAVFAEAASGVPGVAPVTLPDTVGFIPPLLRLATVGTPEALRLEPSAIRSVGNPLESVAESALSLDASVGTLVHRVLEMLAKNGLNGPGTAAVCANDAGWRRWLVSQGLDAEAAARGAAQVAAIIEATLQSETGRWLLAEHAEAGAEQAWTTREGEATAQHIIDRVFVADGCRWIVDYKTVHAAEDELAARAESFRPQLERYARLFSGDPLPLRLAVFFTRQAKLIELPTLY